MVVLVYGVVSGLDGHEVESGLGGANVIVNRKCLLQRVFQPFGASVVCPGAKSLLDSVLPFEGHKGNEKNSAQPPAGRAKVV